MKLLHGRTSLGMPSCIGSFSLMHWANSSAVWMSSQQNEIKCHSKHEELFAHLRFQEERDAKVNRVPAHHIVLVHERRRA